MLNEGANRETDQNIQVEVDSTELLEEPSIKKVNNDNRNLMNKRSPGKIKLLES